MNNKNKDLCLKCGVELKSALWGAECHGHAVHQRPCDHCGRLIGYIGDDDYCGIEILVCPDCMDKARKKG